MINQGQKCQYEFSFPNEYTDELINSISELTNIKENDIHDNILKYDSNDEMIYVVKDNKENFILTKYNKKHWMYLVIIRCDEKYSKEIEKILCYINEDIEENYGEDHSKEINNVINNTKTFFYRIDKQYKISVKLKENY